VRTGSDVVWNIDFGFSVNYGHQHYGIPSSKPFWSRRSDFSPGDSYRESLMQCATIGHQPE
jgi:hypothetical protein